MYIRFFQLSKVAQAPTPKVRGRNLSNIETIRQISVSLKLVYLILNGTAPARMINILYSSPAFRPFYIFCTTNGYIWLDSSRHLVLLGCSHLG